MPEEYNHSVMTWNTAKKAIDMYFLNLSKNPKEYDDFVKMIIFYGGEPLLNFKLIKQCVEYIEECYKKELEVMDDLFHFSIITNGTVINEEMALFFKEHKNFSIAISVDGPKEIHDNKRISCNGHSSFDDAINGYKLLKEVGGCNNIALSCTIDEHNIDRLPELINLHEEYGFTAINLNAPLDTNQKTISKPYAIKVSKQMLEYFAIAREKGVYEDRVMRKMNALIDKDIHAYDCQATGAQIVCSPDGKLGVCHEGIGLKNFFFGTVAEDFDFHNNPLINEWKKRSPLNMPQCFDCSAIGICGGGCTYGAWLRNGSIWSVDDRFCPHSLITLEWLIWDLFEKM